MNKNEKIKKRKEKNRDEKMLHSLCLIISGKWLSIYNIYTYYIQLLERKCKNFIIEKIKNILIFNEVNMLIVECLTQKKIN